MLQPHLVFRGKLNPSNFALAEGGCLIAQIIEEEAEFEVRIFWRLIVYNSLLFLYFLLLVVFGCLRLLHEIFLLAATGQSFPAFLSSLAGDLYGVAKILVIPVVSLVHDLADDVI